MKEKDQQMKKKEQQIKDKAQKRQEEDRILNQDINKLPQALQKAFEIYQAQILKEWENEAELLGFDNYIPPFASASGQDILKGVNYASGSSGIRDETGQHLNRSDYMYWDAVHPTEAANVMVAGRSYVTLDPSDTYPIDIHGLAQL
ncbi:hypothetical protein LWI28_021740 [Acer negundo]|uniref:Uncharacterized protein n=1 Tax=Acer negundo TaxID=4023 RepID=A0AAD5NSZ3_ACENE|nr:hypothetical protein LWI28_021740 [Acer negundo]